FSFLLPPCFFIIQVVHQSLWQRVVFYNGKNLYPKRALKKTPPEFALYYLQEGYQSILDVIPWTELFLELYCLISELLALPSFYCLIWLHHVEIII
ncbi:hypothetical protein ACJX0J_010842, partial [Zea mays]